MIIIMTEKATFGNRVIKPAFAKRYCRLELRGSCFGRITEIAQG